MHGACEDVSRVTLMRRCIAVARDWLHSTGDRIALTRPRQSRARCAAFYDHTWNKRLTSSIGYSGVRITNSDGQSALAFHSGQYALANLLYSPDPVLLLGGEFQWAPQECVRRFRHERLPHPVHGAPELHDAAHREKGE
jgi:hypothetical protein